MIKLIELIEKYFWISSISHLFSSIFNFCNVSIDVRVAKTILQM